ncbi:MAG TPA: alpha/beta hydrolase [Solirubrobacterales bacterium]|nr:alpha/beta hydrolase [Solirubrobacterales bacterium]
MWERLATTPRQDRVLHGAAKALNVAIGLVVLPLWLIGQRLMGPLRRLVASLAPEQPAPLPVPPERERSMAALGADLEALPRDLRPSPFAELRRGLADVSTFVLSQVRETSGLGYSYPAQFTDHVFPGADGERIAASIAVHPVPRPGLIVAHGLFTSRRFDYVRQIAVDAFYRWGFDVAALDLRSFGLTNFTSTAPSTAGWKEGEDIAALGRYLKQLGATSVGAIGISLGGCAVLCASDLDEADTALDGGILAVSPPAEPRAVAERLSRRVPRSHPAYALNYAFHAMLTSRVRGSGWPVEIASLADPIELLSAPYYGLEADEIWRRAAPVNHVGGARVPTLILHPVDDRIVKVDEARKLAAAASGTDLVRVWELEAGKHGILEAIDRAWTFAVYRTFFERWATYAERAATDRAREDLVGADVVYSPGDG